MEFADLHTLAIQQPNEIVYVEVSPESRIVRQLPKFCYGPVPERFSEWYSSDNWIPPVGMFFASDVMLMEDRVLIWRDKILCIPQNGMHENSIEGDVEQRSANIKKRMIDEQVVLLCGPGHLMYGHWIIDFLPRLYVLTLLGYDITKLRYLLPHNINQFTHNLLAALGIKREQLIAYDAANEQCKIKHALIPTNLRGNSLASPLFPPAIKDFKKRLGINTEIIPVRQIFVSRRGWNNMTRQLKNADAIEATFSQRNFEIVYPERKSFIEQVKLFSESRIIAGEYGSGLHNSIFAAPNSSIIALRGTEAHPWFLQSGLCDVFTQDCCYIFGKTDIVNEHQVFSIDETDLASCIDSVTAK